MHARANELRGLDQQRAQLWREAAHDLRGNAVLNAAAGLTRGDLPDEARERVLRALGRSSGSLQSLLEDVTSLARLQAGREQLVIKPNDVAINHRRAARQ